MPSLAVWVERPPTPSASMSSPASSSSLLSLTGTVFTAVEFLQSHEPHGEDKIEWDVDSSPREGVKIWTEFWRLVRARPSVTTLSLCFCTPHFHWYTVSPEIYESSVSSLSVRARGEWLGDVDGRKPALSAMQHMTCQFLQSRAQTGMKALIYESPEPAFNLRDMVRTGKPQILKYMAPLFGYPDKLLFPELQRLWVGERVQGHEFAYFATRLHTCPELVEIRFDNVAYSARELGTILQRHNLRALVLRGEFHESFHADTNGVHTHIWPGVVLPDSLEHVVLMASTVQPRAFLPVFTKHKLTAFKTNIYLTSAHLNGLLHTFTICDLVLPVIPGDGAGMRAVLGASVRGHKPIQKLTVNQLAHDQIEVLRDAVERAGHPILSRLPHRVIVKNATREWETVSQHMAEVSPFFSPTTEDTARNVRWKALLAQRFRTHIADTKIAAVGFLYGGASSKFHAQELFGPGTMDIVMSYLQ